MPAGRPPTYDIAEETRQLDEWSKRDDATALCQFCVLRDLWSDIIYNWRDSHPQFALTLKKAKMRIANRLRKKLHDKEFPYNYGLFMSEIGFHDQFHHDYVESLKDRDAERKKAIAGSQNTTYNIMVPNDLAIGSNLPTKALSDSDNKGSE